ncbi:MAG: 4Fe-4S binding protein [Alphaproteobacteria bacterium]|nr:4Fe-4S binding protein [Alphaproteobacteria bacterium]
MAFKIEANKCVGCQTCMAVCPAMAISAENGKCVIDKTKCMQCGTCASVCPMSAITKEN